MSAIFGALGPISNQELDAMAERLAHNGAYSYYWSPADGVWLGEVRHSPRSSDEDELTAFSGQLYLDSRRNDSSNDDDESLGRDHRQRHLVTSAVRIDSLGFAKNLDGHFGVASWDPTVQHLILTVDRLRYERLYFTEVSGRFVFASEYKALLALEDVEAVPDFDAIQYSIATVSPNFGRTLFRNITPVPPGHALVVSKDKKETVAYFQPKCVPEDGALDDFATNLRQILVDDVKTLLSHHDRIAITLSGGLDSAGLLGVIRHTLPDVTIAAYTIAADAFDPELIGAGRAADHYGIEHNKYEFEPDSIISDIPKLVWLAEEFASREESVLQYQLESQILGRESVVTNGCGADSALAGMPRHRLIRMAELLPFARTAMTEIYQQTQSGVPPNSALGRFGSWLLYRGGAIEPPQVLGAKSPSRVYEPTSIAEARGDAMTTNNFNQYHSAYASMAPTEVIMPYMSRNFTEYCMKIPTRHVIGFRHQKLVLRQALAPFVPDEIRNRGKSIQRARRDTALSDAIDSLASSLLVAEAVKSRGLIGPDYIAEIRKRPADGIYRGHQLTRLWMLIIIEIWCRTFLDQRGDPWGFDRDDLWASTPRRL